MSTKTMRPPPRRVAGIINKRKERDHDGFNNRPTTVPTTTPKITKLSKPNKPIAESKPINEGSSIPKGIMNNQLLAGYMAHEFLTKGTLLGRKVGPKIRTDEVEPLQEKYERYVDVTELMKTNGTHLPGVVNPTQLGPVLGPFR